MENASSDSVPVSVDAVINSLTIQGISFRGPFCTPGQRTVFVVESHILLESELAELLHKISWIETVSRNLPNVSSRKKTTIRAIERSIALPEAQEDDHA